MATNDIILYLRVSTLKQDHKRQLDDLTRWCDGKYYIVKTFEDKLSGFDNEREGLSDMKKYLIANNIKNVAVWELSRLSRDKIYLQQLCRWFEQNQIQVYFYEQGFYLLDGKNKINDTVDWTITIMSKLVETEAATIKDRMASGRMNARQQGRYGGGVIPVGYIVNPETKYFEENNVIVEGIQMSVANCVRYVFSRYIKGDISIADLARECLFKNFPTPLTNIPTLRSVLRNKTYTGENERQKAPQLISIDLYNAVQVLMKSKLTFDVEKKKKHIYFCKGLIKCPYCNINYLGLSGKGQYICMTNRTGSKIVRGTNICKSAAISNNNLDSIAWDLTKRYVLKNDSLFAFNPTDYQKEIDEETVKIDVCNREIAELEKNKKKIVVIFRNDGMTEIEFNKEMSNINNEIKVYKNEIVLANEKMNRLKTQYNEYETQSQQIASMIYQIHTITDPNIIYDLIHKVIKYFKIYNGDNKFKKVIEFQYATDDRTYYILWCSNKKANEYSHVNDYSPFSNENDTVFSFDDLSKTFQSDPLVFSFDEMYEIAFKSKYSMVTDSLRKKDRNKKYSDLTQREKAKKAEYMRNFRKQKREEWERTENQLKAKGII